MNKWAPNIRSRSLSNQSTSGFTIIELLIVIVIIAILAAITIVAYSGFQTRARQATAQADAEQLAKLLSASNVTNGSYPSDLTTINNGGPMPTNDGTTYIYHPGSGNSSYCVTVTNISVSYMITDSNTTPQPGGCPGDGVNGQSAVTNLALNPSFEAGTSTLAPYNGSTVSQVNVGPSSAVSGSYVGRVIRGTPGAALLAMIYPIPYTANTPVSVRFSVRLSPGSTSTNTLPANNFSVQGYNGGTGAGAATGCSKSITPSTLSTTSWSQVVLQGCTTPNTTMNQIGIQINPGQSWAATDGIDIDGIMIAQSSTAPNFADGNTPSWIWNGATNASTSTGPAQ